MPELVVAVTGALGTGTREAIGSAVGGLMGANEIIAAVVGALTTGAIGLLISWRKREASQRDTNDRILCLLLDEIVGHGASLDLFLNRSMPRWLRRGPFTQLLVKGEDGLPSLRDDMYNEFRHELLHSRLLVQLVAYYRYVRNLNSFDRETIWQSVKLQSEFISDCIVLQDTTLLAIADILAQPGIRRYFTTRIKNDVDDYTASVATKRLKILIARSSYDKLKGLLDFLNTPEEFRVNPHLGVEEWRAPDAHTAKIAKIAEGPNASDLKGLLESYLAPIC